MAPPSELNCDPEPQLEPELSESDEWISAGGMAAPEDMIRGSRPGG